MSTIVEKGLSKTDIFTQLLRSPHEGKTQTQIEKKQKLTDVEKLSKYLPVATQAVQQEAEFYAHMLVWNLKKGQIRDSKIALPLLQMRSAVPEFRDNALACLATLDPRNLLRAWAFAKDAKVLGGSSAAMHRFQPLVTRYLMRLERNMGKWERTFIQHRKSIYTLYGWSRSKAPEAAGAMLRGEYVTGSTLDIIRRLKDMTPSEAAGQIINRGIPFLVAKGALGARVKEPDMLMALIERMTASELVTNMKWLEKCGVKSTPALRGALEKALSKASGSTANLLKTTLAVEEGGIEDEEIRERLKGLQERQLQKQPGIEGDWAVLADCSGSMSAAIEAGRQIAAILAKQVRGRVHLIFFATEPRALDVTGKTYDEILSLTKNIPANGGTSIGCAMDWLRAARHEVGGIAIVSDGAENNRPWFVDAYQAYCRAFGGITPPIYLYWLQSSDDMGALARMVADRDMAMTTFDLRAGVDYVSLPQLVGTMRTNRYSLIDEIVGFDLLTLDRILGPAA